MAGRKRNTEYKEMKGYILFIRSEEVNKIWQRNFQSGDEYKRRKESKGEQFRSKNLSYPEFTTSKARKEWISVS